MIRIGQIAEYAGNHLDAEVTVAISKETRPDKSIPTEAAAGFFLKKEGDEVKVIIVIEEPPRVEKGITYVVTWENDGDFSDCELKLATQSYTDALKRAAQAPETDFAYGVITTYDQDGNEKEACRWATNRKEWC